MSNSLSTAAKLATHYVSLLMAFGFGVLLTSAGVFGEYGIGLGSLLVLFGALYGTLLGSVLWWRMRRVPAGNEN